MEISEIFGSLVFNDSVMKQRLPKETYNALKKTISEGKDLELSLANVVANAMKDWAVSKGATHYTHWFQPMTGITAEKHDSFISPISDGSVIMEFSGKELVKGEPDASSFPSGGLRATFEARGYTAWDPTSYAFIKDRALCIPTVFCSYGGESLDKKTPLLRSMEALNEQAVRLMHLIGNNDVTAVNPSVGSEQEYFLIDNELYKKRKDLIFTGRTLFGAKAPKGQELEDHYYGTIKPRVSAFMAELDEELWKLGISAKTEHNEAAPAQHELAPIFENANLATDHNQLTMEMMKKIAGNHGLACLLHEKPFEGVNGSGKHNNWSLNTNTGKNLLNPGKHPNENPQFLLVLCAVIKAVDEYQDLLRLSVATAGNDHRLGAHEAPPAIVSIFLGDELTEILESYENDTPYDVRKKQKMEIGVHGMPVISKDSTDRNRTSPFAYTGNKFEFRMLGSSISIAEPNIMLNTIVAEEFRKFADELEKAEDVKAGISTIIKETVKNHKRIIFNGNNYSNEWVEEAERRSLLNLRSTPEAILRYRDEKNIELFTSHKIFTRQEVLSRCEILLENYTKVLNVEGLTMVNMAKQEILPAILSYEKHLAESVSIKRAIGECPDTNYKRISCKTETVIISKLATLADEVYEKTEELADLLKELREITECETSAFYCKDKIVPAMESLRKSADEAESLLSKEFIPYPTYADLLFSV